MSLVAVDCLCLFGDCFVQVCCCDFGGVCSGSSAQNSLPQNESQRRPYVRKNKKTYKTWLSLVKFVSVEFRLKYVQLFIKKNYRPDCPWFRLAFDSLTYLCNKSIGVP